MSRRFMSAAGHGRVLVPGGAPIMLIAGILMVIVGLTVLLRPQWFGTSSAWNFGQSSRRPQGPVYAFTNRLIGASFCVFGLVLVVIGIANL